MPSTDYPPIQAHRFSHGAYDAGIEEHMIDGVSVKIYWKTKARKMHCIWSMGINI
jgi:hypothetical protein